MYKKYRMDVLTIIAMIIQVVAWALFFLPWMYTSQWGNMYEYSFISSMPKLAEPNSFFKLLLVVYVISSVFILIRLIFLFQGKDARVLGITASIMIAVTAFIYIAVFQIQFAQLREDETAYNTIVGILNIAVHKFSGHNVDLRDLYSLSAFPYLAAIMGIISAVLEGASAYLSHPTTAPSFTPPGNAPDSFDPFEQPAGLPNSSDDSPFF